MRAILVAVLMASVALAGCADSSSAQVDETEQKFEEKGLEATADTGVIRGVVVDAQINPIADVTVRLLGTELETTSDAEGLFGFGDLEPGFYNIEASKTGYTTSKIQEVVEAGVDKPPIVRIVISIDEGSIPYIEPLTFNGHLTCGVAIFATSVGCTTFAIVAQQIGDQSIFQQKFSTQPDHVQGELVWDNTQLLAGRFIWEITPGGNSHIGYRETEHSPALAYLDNETIAQHADVIMDDNGINWRFFGGPHDLCPGTGYPNSFGCGVTLEQSAEVYIHAFYNMQPDEGWRFTSDGEHP